MEPKAGYTQRQLWADSEPAIGQKSSPSYDIKEGDILHAVAAITNLPSSTLPDSPFIRALGTPAAQKAPPQTGTLAQRALEEWERTLCENKAVAILAQMQAGRPALIQKDGGEMLIAIVLDRPLAEIKQQWKEWMATNDHISYICADSCYAWYLSHVTWRVNSINGPAQLHFPSLLN